MCQGVNPLTGEDQSFYFDEEHPSMKGWFKGMEQIIRECGLWPETGLLADCPKKCPLAGKTAAVANSSLTSLTLFLRS
jgi:hypothetical protein